MRFFFDIHDGLSHVVDHVGADLTGLDEARDTAAVLVADIAHEAMPDGSDRTFAVILRDEHGVEIHRSEMVFQARPYGPHVGSGAAAHP